MSDEQKRVAEACIKYFTTNPFGVDMSDTVLLSTLILYLKTNLRKLSQDLKLKQTLKENLCSLI